MVKDNVGVNTFSANATSDKILSGYTAYVKGKKITGTCQQGSVPGSGCIHPTENRILLNNVLNKPFLIKCCWWNTLSDTDKNGDPVRYFTDLILYRNFQWNMGIKNEYNCVVIEKQGNNTDLDRFSVDSDWIGTWGIGQNPYYACSSVVQYSSSISLQLNTIYDSNAKTLEISSESLFRYSLGATDGIYYYYI